MRCTAGRWGCLGMGKGSADHPKELFEGMTALEHERAKDRISIQERLSLEC